MRLYHNPSVGCSHHLPPSFHSRALYVFSFRRSDASRSLVLPVEEKFNFTICVCADMDLESGRGGDGFLAFIASE